MQKPAVGEAQNVPVIRLYEDLTNILVTGVRVDKSPEFPDIDENIMFPMNMIALPKPSRRVPLLLWYPC